MNQNTSPLVNLIVRYSLNYRHNWKKKIEHFKGKFFLTRKSNTSTQKQKQSVADNHIKCKRQSVHTKHAIREHPGMSLGMH